MKLLERMKRSIANMKGEIVLTREMLKLGERSNVSRCLRQCVEQGILFKIGFGVYAKARTLSTGMVVPRCTSLRELAGQTLLKLGVEYELGALERDYNAGSTQVPARASFEVYGRRISRKLAIAPQKPVLWENRLKSGRGK